MEEPLLDHRRLSIDRIGENSASIRVWMRVAREKKRICFRYSMLLQFRYKYEGSTSILRTDVAGDSLVRQALI
jgi:hypothetical protein